MVLPQNNHRTLAELLDNVLNKVGPTFKQVIHDELEREGVKLDVPSTSLADVEKALVRIFGPDAASLLLNAIWKEMEKG